MDNLAYIIGGLVGLAVGFLIDRAIKGGAYRARAQILSDAKQEAQTLLKDQEIELNKEILKRREQLESKLDEARDAIRAREREVDQRLVHLAYDANVAILSLGEKLRNKLRISNKAKELLELRRGDE